MSKESALGQRCGLPMVIHTSQRERAVTTFEYDTLVAFANRLGRR